MTDNTKSFCSRNAQNQKTLFIFRVLRIVKQNGILIIKNSFSFFKCNTMYAFVSLILLFIPCKAQLAHTYIIHISYSLVNL